MAEPGPIAPVEAALYDCDGYDLLSNNSRAIARNISHIKAAISALLSDFDTKDMKFFITKEISNYDPDDDPEISAKVVGFDQLPFSDISVGSYHLVISRPPPYIDSYLLFVLKFRDIKLLTT